LKNEVKNKGKQEEKWKRVCERESGMFAEQLCNSGNNWRGALYIDKKANDRQRAMGISLSYKKDSKKHKKTSKKVLTISLGCVIIFKRSREAAH